MTTRNGVRGHRLRVVHVVSQLHMGGMEKLLLEFARHTNRGAFELRCVCFGERGVLADELENLNCRVTTLNVGPGLLPSLVVRLARLLRAWQPAIVHTHNTRPIINTSLAARLAGVPGVVHTRHGQRFFHGRRRTLAFRLAARLVDRLVCVSQDSARLSVEEGIPRSKVSTIWNGIDVSRFTYAGAEGSGPAVMVGRLSPEKDVSTLLDAIPLVLRTYPSFRLKIAGGGECLTPLQQQAGKLGITGSVDFLGEVRDVASLLAQASLFVLPSLTEGMSLTLLEAMARGLPVVATRVGGNAEVVVDGETGLLVPPRSPAGLADAMLQVYADAERARRMGQAGRERVELHFDVRRMVVDYEALYRKVLESKTRRLLTRWTNPHKAVVTKMRPKRHSSARTAL